MNDDGGLNMFLFYVSTVCFFGVWLFAEEESWVSNMCMFWSMERVREVSNQINYFDTHTATEVVAPTC